MSSELDDACGACVMSVEEKRPHGDGSIPLQMSETSEVLRPCRRILLRDRVSVNLFFWPLAGKVSLVFKNRFAIGVHIYVLSVSNRLFP